MKTYWRIGIGLALAVVFGGTPASAQVGGPATGAQAGGSARGDSADADDQAPEKKDESVKKVATPRPKHLSSFNRVSTTRTEVVPAPSQGARAGGASAGAGTKSGADARAKAANGGVPAGSTARQEPQRPTTPPATTTRTITHNYYPTMRRGLGPNANTPQVGRTRRGQIGVMAGMGSGTGSSRTAASRSHWPDPGAGPSTFLRGRGSSSMTRSRPFDK